MPKKQVPNLSYVRWLKKGLVRAVTENQQPILVLGAGINGAAVARELLLNGLSVCIVDMGDLAGGTTAYSSRLIHGGLRYLEYGEFSLVRESLRERERLLRLAPQFVRPQRFHIPVRGRLGGWTQAARRFFGRPRRGPVVSRGFWLVRTGLALYDWIARGDDLPAASSGPLSSRLPTADTDQFRWVCSYSDAQILYPERLVVALLEDARRLAEQRGLSFDVLTYHTAGRLGDEVHLSQGSNVTRSLKPSAIVNATGAWVDQTLEKLAVQTSRLIGGTKGSHLLVDNAELAASLGGDAVYLEASDGRPVFLLPFRGKTLIGTTDLPFEENPATATASEDEISYLLAAANELFSATELSPDDVVLHYAGVRPLPYVSTSSTAGAITRRHFLKQHPGTQPPMFSVIGGKLTTCRALAEHAAREILGVLRLPYRFDSRDRPLPGADGYPATAAEQQNECARIAGLSRFTLEQVEAVWWLCGSQAESLLGENDDGTESVSGTCLPIRFVRHVIRSEWVRQLGDLVERRLMLLFDKSTSERTLQHLAQLLSDEGHLEPGKVDAEVAAYRQTIAERYGRRL